MQFGRFIHCLAELLRFFCTKHVKPVLYNPVGKGVSYPQVLNYVILLGRELEPPLTAYNLP